MNRSNEWWPKMNSSVHLRVLCDSVVGVYLRYITTETQRTQKITQRKTEIGPQLEVGKAGLPPLLLTELRLARRFSSVFFRQ